MRNTRDVALGDFDGDGDLDAVFGYLGTIYDRIFLNDGSGTFSLSPEQSGTIGTTSTLAVSDLDHDGFSEDGVHTLRVLDNDRDPQGDVLTITATSLTTALGATLTITNGGRTVTYDGTTALAVQALAAGQFADDTFTYTVSDGNGGTDTATVTIRIAGAAEPVPLFTTGDDTVNLNDYPDLSFFTQATDALAGDDDVILSETQNIGIAFDGNAGNDTITGSSHADLIYGGTDADSIMGGAGNDTISGGVGADRLYGDAGNDTLYFSFVDYAAGEVIDGGADTDTLQIDGGGAVSLVGVTVTSVEDIQLTDTTGTTLTVQNAAQAALISSAAGANDIVHIGSSVDVTEALVKGLIIDAGVETVTWLIPGFASTVEAVPDGLGGFIISYDDGDDVQPWDTIDAQYDNLGRKVAQTNDYDFPGPEGGVTLNFTYDPATGFATTIVNTDGHLTRTFSTITTTLENGVVTKVDTINDNGTSANTDDTLVEQFFTAGVITLERTTDTSSANAGKPWLYQDREYVNDGVLHTTTQTFRTFWDAGVNGGGEHVVGAAGAQVIEGVATGGGVSTTNDALIGGAGADTFRFVPGFGHDTIYDFADGTDLLDLSSYAAGIDTLAELQNAASITQVAFGAGFNTVIAFNGTGDQITIRNLTVAQLSDADFAV
jgi:VCBS repeat-containing protein